jgi:hypothetical protein
MLEQRKYDRITTEERAVVVELRYAAPRAPEESRTVFCSTADLSKDGLRLKLEKSIPVDTAVRVTVIFSVPPKYFEHIGRVRWVREACDDENWEIGVEFLAKNPGETRAWQEFLEATFPTTLRELFDPQANAG